MRNFGTHVLGAVFALALTWISARAQEDQVYVQYRQKLMESVGANMGALADIVRNQLPFGPAHLAAHARAIEEGSALMEAAFKKGISEGKTDAKPEIWTDWSRFVEEVEKFRTESSALVKLVDAGASAADVGKQTQKMAGTCRSCHQAFRKPRTESYKRQSE